MFWKLLSQAAKSIIENRRVLAKALTIPFLIVCALYSIMGFLPETWYSFFAEWLTYVVEAIFAITTHRVVLLGGNSVPKLGLTKWTKRETYFVLHLFGLFAIVLGLGGLGMYILVYILSNSLGLLGMLIAVTIWATCAYIFARLSLVFPSIAIDQGISFKKSWELTEGNEDIIVNIVILVPLLFIIPQMLLSLLFLIPEISNLGTDPTIFNLVTETLRLLFTVFVIAALSLTYKFILEESKKEKPSEI
jgi:hypothetical protein